MNGVQQPKTAEAASFEAPANGVANAPKKRKKESQKPKPIITTEGPQQPMYVDALHPYHRLRFRPRPRLRLSRSQPTTASRSFPLPS